MLKTRIAVFVSGGGTNLQALLDAQAEGKLNDGEIVLVLSSNPAAYALQRAEKAGVSSVTVSRKDSASQAEFEAAISRELENAGLITRVRQGWNQANRIFLQIPDGVQVSSRPEGNNCPMDGQISSPCMGQKLPTSNTDTEYKEHSKTEKVESTRRRYGEFQNVFLSDEECSQLETAYPGKAAEYIERLSRYMASNDRHYANHYATIKKWLDEDSKGMSAKNYTYDDNEGECL